MKCFKLDVWHKSKSLCVEIYRYFNGFRDFGFRDQITRSSLSIPSNIAEGAERRSDKDTCHLWTVAKASCAELFTQIQIGIEIGYIDPEFGNKITRDLNEVSGMLGGLIKRVKID